MRYFILFLLLSPYTLFAQDLLFDEEFKDNTNGWVVSSNEKRTAKMDKGRYQMTHLRPKGSWYFWNKVPYWSHSEDFTIETKIRLADGVDNYRYGLAWAVEDADNLYGFAISGNGLFRIYKYTKGKYKPIVSWTTSDAVKKKGSFNILKITRKGNKIYYYINDTKVHTDLMGAFYGIKLGYIVEHEMTVEAEYLKVYQDREINLVENAKQGRVKEALSENINTANGDIMPIISADGQTLYFVRKRYPSNMGSENKDDVWVSKLQKNGEWGPAENLGPPINNEQHNQLLYISADGNTMIVGNRYDETGKSTTKGLSLSHRTNEGWEIPEPIEVENFYNLASQHSFSASANRKVLILSVERKDAYGSKDLYVSFQASDNEYTQPINMGPQVNTFYNESTPFLAPDGRTLYFSSAGHPGYGRADIFVSKRLDDSWTNWSEPKNLGPEINGPRWDAYYTVPAKGDYAIMVSSTETSGNTQLYKVTLPKDAQPDPVVLVAGNVYRADTKAPLGAQISFTELSSQNDRGIARANPEDGAFQMVLPFGSTYGLAAIHEGYYPAAEQLDLENVSEYTEIQKNVYLHPIKNGEVIPLNAIVMDEEGSIAANSQDELDRLTNLLITYPKMKIELRGKEDAVETLKNSLSNQHIDPKRIKTKAGSEKLQFKIVSLGDREIKANNQGSFSEKINTEELEVGHTFRIENLYFQADSASFTNNSIRSLDELSRFLKAQPKLVIEVGGHTNGLPAHAYCDRLSEARAKQVAQYLSEQGIPNRQIEYKGYGKRRPVADNATDLGRRRNQRVEIKVLKVE